MANPVLQILEPAHGARIAGAAGVRLRAQVTGSTAGLFFKWYSTLNPAATANQPELNANHSAASLDFTTPLDVGTHVITLAAADREGSDLASVQQVTRSGFTGGKPGATNPTPLVVHRLLAVLRTPANNNANLSRASTTLEARAPVRWGKKQSGVYVLDTDYHELNQVRFRFRFAPAGPPDPARTADVTPTPAQLTFFDADNLTYVRWQGALPGNLQNGAHTLTLFVETTDGAVAHSVSRPVVLTA
jgi:hypothetical protein